MMKIGAVGQPCDCYDCDIRVISNSSVHHYTSLGSRPSPFRVRFHYAHAAIIQSQHVHNENAHGTGKAWNRGYHYTIFTLHDSRSESSHSHVYMYTLVSVSCCLQEAHVNSCYKHFYYFVTEFSLVDSKEFEPLVSTCTIIGLTVVTSHNTCTIIGLTVVTSHNTCTIIGLTVVTSHNTCTIIGLTVVTSHNTCTIIGLTVVTSHNTCTIIGLTVVTSHDSS